MPSGQDVSLELYEALSRREREILALLADGLSNREIAERLIIGYTTVKWHNRQIFGKLGVENREQAIERAAKLGLLMPKSADAPNHNLPSQLTPFIGRSKELDDLSRWLSQPHPRLITLLAPGGMGKTRLALEAAETVLGQYPDGVFFVPLAPVTSDDHVISAVTDACGLTLSPDGRSPEQQLLDFLRRKRTLLVLDNFEHLLDSAPLVTDFLTAAPQIKALVTSRERLSLMGEVVYPLAGLHYPDHSDTDDLLRYGAVQLFIECALRANPGFGSDDVTAIGQICRLVEGMPLAIELAAAWSRTLSPIEIAVEIERSADFLSTTMRDVPERLRSVRAVFEAAWARLTDDERRVFRRMSVFRGGCTREAAQAVVDADTTILTVLVDKALLWRNPQTERYEIHELLRQYAEQELEAAGETEATRQAHQAYYAQFAYRWGKATQGSESLKAMKVLDADTDNVRQAFERAIEQGTPEPIEPFTEIWHHYWVRGWLLEGGRLYEQAIQKLEPHDSVALGRLLHEVAIWRSVQGVNDQPVEGARRSVEMLRRLGADHALPRALMHYGEALQMAGQRDAAAVILDEGLDLARQTGNPHAEALILNRLGVIASQKGQHELGKELLLQGYRMMAGAGSAFGMCGLLGNLAFAVFQAGDYDTAQRYYSESLALARQIHYPIVISNSLSGLVELAYKKGDLRAAYALTEETLEWLWHLGQHGAICFTFTFMAELALELGDTQDARRRLRDALDATGDTYEPNRLYLLTIAVAYLARTGEAAQATAFLSVIENLPAKQELHPDHLEYLDRLLQDCRAALPPDEFDAAYERGKALTIEDALALVSAVV